MKKYKTKHEDDPLRYSLAKLDNKLLPNVQNIRRYHKLYQENHENLEIGIDSRRKKFC